MVLKVVVQRSPRTVGVTRDSRPLVMVKVSRDDRLSFDGLFPFDFSLWKVGLTCVGYLVGYHHWDGELL